MLSRSINGRLLNPKLFVFLNELHALLVPLLALVNHLLHPPLLLLLNALYHSLPVCVRSKLDRQLPQLLVEYLLFDLFVG